MDRFLSTPSARRATCAALNIPGHCKISIHALREEGDGVRRVPYTRQGYFYPRPPRGGRPSRPRRRWILRGISIHALREEGDQDGCRCRRFRKIFLSTPSARRATKALYDAAKKAVISIHALREEGDPEGQYTDITDYPISIHALREEGDVPVSLYTDQEITFLSTPSARRATRLFRFVV